MTEHLDDYDPLFDGGGPGFMLADPAAAAKDRPETVEVDDTRAYLLTGGRTGGGRAGVSMETIVVADRAAMGRLPAGYPELIAIVQRCVQPMAVAEVAAHLSLPLGVVQVLVGDLVADGLLIPSERKVSMHHDIPFLERLIDRVSSL